MNAELCASHRGSGTILVPGGSGHQEGEDSKEAFQHSEKGEPLQPYPKGIYVTGRFLQGERLRVMAKG